MAFPFLLDVVSPAALRARQKTARQQRNGDPVGRDTRARAHSCAISASLVVRRSETACRRVSSGLVGSPALRAYAKSRAKGSADLSAGITRLRVRFAVPGCRSPQVFVSNRLRKSIHARTGGFGTKCTAMASNWPLDERPSMQTASLKPGCQEFASFDVAVPVTRRCTGGDS